MNFDYSEFSITESLLERNLINHLRMLGIEYSSFVSFVGMHNLNLPTYISGSAVEGIGNQYSDVDVFIIGDTQEKDTQIRVLELNNHRIDFEFWSMEKVIQISKMLIENYDNNGFIAANPIHDLTFIHRLLCSVVHSKPDEIQRIRGLFPKYMLQRYLGIFWLGASEDCITDSLGAYQEQDLVYAYIRSREAIDWAIDCYLNSRGDTNTKSKYRVKRLEKYCGSESLIYKKYLEHVFSVTEFQNQKISEKIESNIKFAKYLNNDSSRIMLERTRKNS